VPGLPGKITAKGAVQWLGGSGQAGPAIFPESSKPQCQAAVACHVPIRLEADTYTQRPFPGYGTSQDLCTFRQYRAAGDGQPRCS